MGARLGGRYEVQKRLGATSLAGVFLARDTESGSTVRLEVIHPHLARDRKFVEQFEAALSPARKLKHPGTLGVLQQNIERVEGEWLVYATTKPFEGAAIVDAFRHELPSLDTAVQIGLEVLDALDHANSQGVVHGDICPENVLVARDGGDVRVKVAGFGVSSLAASLIPSIGYGPVASGPPYWSPERARGDDATPSMDVYGVGALLYELLTGSPPFESLSPMEHLRLHTEQTPEPPSRRAPERNNPEALDHAVLQALNPERTERFADAAGFYRALTQISTEISKSGVDAERVLPLPGAVGCDALLDRIRSFAVAPAGPARRGHAVLLLGAAGSGKTTIARAAAVELRGGSIRPILMDGRAGNSVSLGPFIELLRAVLGVRRGAGRKVLKAAADALDRLGLDALDTERVLDLTSARPPTRVLGPQIAHREESTALRHAVTALLEVTPSLLIIDDADSLDPASRRLAGELMARSSSRPYGVLLTARYDPWPEWQPSHAVRIDVPEPDESTAIGIARSLLPAAAEQVVNQVADVSKRSPWLLSLRARAVRAASGDPEKAAASLTESPEALVKLILDATSAPARRWLMGAALSGKRTPLALLDSWQPATGSHDELTKSCIATGLVRREGDYLVFETEGTRVAVGDLVPPAEAKDIHRHFSRWMSSGEPPRGEIQVIARHLFAAGDVPGAANRYEQAGRALLAREDGGTATQLLTSARAAWQEVDEPIGAGRSGLLLAEACLLAGDTRSAEEALNEASAELKRAPPPADDKKARRRRAILEAAALKVEARLRRMQKRSDEAAAILERAVGLIATSGYSREWYEIEHELVSLLLEMDRLEAAHQHALEAVEVARALDKPVEEDLSLSSMSATPTTVSLADALSQSGKVQLELDKVEDARESFENASKHAAAVGNESAGARALANLAHALATGGNDSEASEKATVALALATRVGDRDAAARIALSLGTYRLRLGQPDDALEAFKQARLLAAAIGWHQGEKLAKEATVRVNR